MLSTLKGTITLLSVIATINGCVGPAAEKHTPEFIDDEFIEYVISFEDLAGTTVDFVEITFRSLDEPTIGVATTGVNPVTVHIDPEFWFSNDHFQREQLMFHELAHAVYKMPHDNAVIFSGDINREIPASIMNSKLIPAWIYFRYHEYYTIELADKLDRVKKTR